MVCFSTGNRALTRTRSERLFTTTHTHTHTHQGLLFSSDSSDTMPTLHKKAYATSLKWASRAVLARQVGRAKQARP